MLARGAKKSKANSSAVAPLPNDARGRRNGRGAPVKSDEDVEVVQEKEMQVRSREGSVRTRTVRRVSQRGRGLIGVRDFLRGGLAVAHHARAAPRRTPYLSRVPIRAH